MAFCSTGGPDGISGNAPEGCLSRRREKQQHVQVSSSILGTLLKGQKSGPASVRDSRHTSEDKELKGGVEMLACSIAPRALTQPLQYLDQSKCIRSHRHLTCLILTDQHSERGVRGGPVSHRTATRDRKRKHGRQKTPRRLPSLGRRLTS